MRSLLIASFFLFFTSCYAYHALQSIEGLTHKILKRVSSCAELNKNQFEGLPGNPLADLSLYITSTTSSDNKADFCLLNNCGLRSVLPRGDNTIKGVYEPMTFVNELVSFIPKGPATQLLIEFIALKGGMPVSGIKMGIKNENPIHVLIDEKSFDVTEDYKIVTSEYLAKGGDNLSFLATSKDKNYAGIKVRDAFIKYMTEQQSTCKKPEAIPDSRIYNG